MKDQIEKLIDVVDESWEILKQSIYECRYAVVLGPNQIGSQCEPDPEMKKRGEQHDEVCNHISREAKTLAGRLAKGSPETAKRLFQFAQLAEDGTTFDSRPDHPCVTKEWVILKPELQVVAAQSCTDPNSARKDGRTVNERVRTHIAKKLGDGWKIEDFKRDDVARAVHASAGAISGSAAWKEVADAKDRSKLPSTTNSQYDAAVSRQDWKEAKRLAKEGHRPY